MGMNAYVKYPRTYHLPWSAGRTDDDKTLGSTEHFNGRMVVVTEKMDGENTSLYSDYFHARSLDGNSHWTQDWLKSFHSKFAYEIPSGWRICGENVYAEHSIAYDNLESYFYGFSIWDDKNVCLDWDTTLGYFDILGIKHVPVLYEGIWDEDVIRNIQLDFDKQEGYVVRVRESFSYFGFKDSVAKYVRKGHVQEDSGHWKSGDIGVNGLVDDNYYLNTTNGR
jgi:RNA ligase